MEYCWKWRWTPYTTTTTNSTYSFHLIILTCKVGADLQAWQCFIENFNGKSCKKNLSWSLSVGLVLVALKFNVMFWSYTYCWETQIKVIADQLSRFQFQNAKISSSVAIAKSNLQFHIRFWTIKQTCFPLFAISRYIA